MTTVTPAQVATELRRVRDLVKDGRNDALAHSWIDELYVQVLRAIAEGRPDPAELAAEALKGEEIQFERRFDK